MNILNTIILIVAGVILAFVIMFIIYKFTPWFEKKKKKEEIPPQEIIELLNKVERRYLDLSKNGREITCPYSVLWEVFKGNRTGGYTSKTNIPNGTIHKPVESRELYPRIGGQQDIPNGIDSVIEQYTESNRKIKSNHRRNFFSKFRRRR